MKYKSNLWRDMLWSAAFVGTIALSVLLVGCGDDKGSDVAVETKSEWKPVQETTVTAALHERETPAPPEKLEEERIAVEVAAIETPGEVTYDEAEDAYRERRYRDAVMLFTRYTELKAENPWGFYMLGLSAW